MEINFLLNPDWDQNINPPTNNKETGHFCGRKKEVDFLVNELKRRKTGSILVSGHRGVGKTSFVYKALWKLKKQLNENKNRNAPIFVLLNASQLEILSKNNNKNDKINANNIQLDKILENLIRRLYSATKNISFKNNNKNIKEKIALLYYKAVASNYSETVKNQIKKVTEKEKEISIKSTISLKQIIVLPLFGLLLLIPRHYFINDIIYSFIKVIIYLIPIGFIFYKYRFSKKTTKTDSAEILYDFDNNIGNLEDDLCKIHNELGENNYKIIYVIDEMDKISIDAFKELIKFFKNFLTLNNAIFIFVADEQAYQLEENEQYDRSKVLRPFSYTYFTSKYFLARPSEEDLKNFCNKIIKTDSTKTNDEKEDKEKILNNLINSLCFDAKDDFFDLIKHIKNRLKVSDDKHQLLIEYNGTHDINKTVMYEMVHKVYDYFHNPNLHSFPENETIKRNLFDYAHSVYNYNIHSPYYNHQDNTFSDIDNNQKEIKNKEIIRLNKWFVHSGIFTEKRHPEAIGNYKYYVYSHTGNLPTEIPNDIAIQGPAETIYLNYFNQYQQYITAIVNFYNSVVPDEEKTGFSLINNNNAPDYLKRIYNVFQAPYNDRDMRSAIELYKNICNKKHNYNKYTKFDINNCKNIIKFLLEQSKFSLCRFMENIIYNYCLKQSTSYKRENYRHITRNLDSNFLRSLLEKMSHTSISQRETNKTVIFIMDIGGDTLSTHKQEINSLREKDIMIIPIGKNVHTLRNNISLLENNFNEQSLSDIKDNILSFFDEPAIKK